MSARHRVVPAVLLPAVLLPVVLLQAGCGSDEPIAGQDDTGAHDTEPFAGAIVGRACDPSGRGWLEGASVYTYLFDDSGALSDARSTTTDAAGAWTLDDLPGEHEYTVYVQDGSALLSTEIVAVGDGEVVVLDDPPCLEAFDLAVAVVSGDYDDTQVVLEEFGIIDYDIVDGLDEDGLVEFLLDAEGLDRYDVVFFNGGHAEDGIIYVTEDPKTGQLPDSTVPDTVLLNLRSYVQQGGMLYASDWAYDLIERAWPDRLDFAGDDVVPDDAQRGVAGTVVGSVSDPGLADRLGVSTVEIEFDLPNWAPIVEATDGVTVYVSGVVSYEDAELGTTSLGNSPLLVGFGEGSGDLVYSTWRVARNSGSDTTAMLEYMLDLAGGR